MFTLALTVCLLGLSWAPLSLAQRPSLSLSRDEFKPRPVVNRPPVEQPSSMEVNLRTGVTSALAAGVTWHSALTSGGEECACDRQGVLKLTFNDADRKRAHIQMTFEQSQGWTFNVGDSVTNNGYGGDSGSQSNDAEVHSLNNAYYIYGRDDPAGGTYGQLHAQPAFVAVNPYTTLTLDIADQLAVADNGAALVHFASPKLFQLGGQGDATGPVNQDVYLAMNRVVASAARAGTGLCKVKVTWFSS